MDTATISMILAVAAMVILIILAGVRISRGQAADNGVTRDEARHALLTREVDDMTSAEPMDDRVLDANGRAALMWDSTRQRIIAVEIPEPTAASSRKRVRSLDSRNVIHAEIRETVVPSRAKDAHVLPRIGMLELLVYVDDLDAPTVAVDLLRSEVKPASAAHLDARAKADRWVGRALGLAHQGARHVAARQAAEALSAAATSGSVDSGVAKREAARMRIADVMGQPSTRA